MALERVTFTVGDSSRCQPQIQTVDVNGTQQTCPFEIGDFERVLDFDINPPSPPDTLLRLGESDTYFPVRYFCLRGCFLFYFKEEDVAETEENGVAYAGKPIGVIPLDRTHIDFPEGGRRVFQKHANSNASKGYEFVIVHTPKKDSNDVKRRDEYIVADTSSQREEWKLALSSRSGGILKDTILRPGGGPAARTSLRNSPTTLPTRAHRNSDDRRGMLISSKTGTMNFTSQRGRSRTSSRSFNPFDDPASVDEGVSNQAKNQQPPPQQDTLSVLDNDLFQKFTDHRFNSDSYTEQFFIDHPYHEADASCREMETTLLAVKRGLRGAVLEQYKYFVQASQEMKIMGKEVAALQRTCAEQLVTLIDGIKDINFAEAFSDEPVIDDEEAYYSDEEDDESDDNDAEADVEVVSLNNLSDASYHSSDEEQESPGRIKMRRNDGVNTNKLGNRRKLIKGSIDYSKEYDGHGSRGAGYPLSPSNSTVGSQVEIPSWLADVTEEISAFKKECRYTEATNLSIKAKTELIEIFAMHEKAPRHQQLTKKQQTSLRRILMEIESLITGLGDRLVETLRRKNEALKQTYKRERQDPFYELMPLVSPVCLEDDASALQLLVKLGRPHDAAVAYSVRRSMHLSECLNERPIANSGSETTDVVIYACQLSQGYFSALAQAVEGFLDLFSSSSSNGNNPTAEKDSDGGSSVVTIAQKKVPARAMANIVLWCDQELAKFASTFGGPRILGRLSLTSATDSAAASGGGDPKVSIHTGAAYKQSASPSLPDKSPQGAESCRQMALVAAAKSVDHAFTSASKYLDSIGLPVLSRLAECIRPRLKGCESEIVALLPERWQHVVFSWAPNEKIFAQNLLRSLDNKINAKTADVDAPPVSVSSRRSTRR